MLLPQWTRYTLGILNLALDKKSDPLFTSIVGLVSLELRRIPKDRRLTSARSSQVPNTFFEELPLLLGMAACSGVSAEF